MFREEVRSRRHQGTNAKGENRHGTLEASEDPQHKLSLCVVSVKLSFAVACVPQW